MSRLSGRLVKWSSLWPHSCFTLWIRYDIWWMMMMIMMIHGCATKFYDGNDFSVLSIFLKLKPEIHSTVAWHNFIDENIIGMSSLSASSTQPYMCFPYVQVELWRVCWMLNMKVKNIATKMFWIYYVFIHNSILLSNASAKYLAFLLISSIVEIIFISSYSRIVLFFPFLPCFFNPPLFAINRVFYL